MSTIFVNVPTFKETPKIEALLASFRLIHRPDIRVLIANGNPGDATTQLIKTTADLPVREIRGNPNLYWAGLTNLGLHLVLSEAKENDWVVLMNADVTFDRDVFAPLLRTAAKKGPCQLGALTHASGRIISSGVAVRSWALGINRHPFAGWSLLEASRYPEEPVDFLPGRCTLIPISAVRSGGTVDERRLAHYAADYEYTNRLKRLGFPAYICCKALVECDAGNTGNCLYHKRSTLAQRFLRLGSLKSFYNPLYRTRFICLTYPWYARPTALAVYLLKTAVEVALGGHWVRKVFRRQEMGFSGARS